MCSSHPLAQQQIDAVDRVLKELDVESIPKLVVWNKVCLFKYSTFLVNFIYCREYRRDPDDKSLCAPNLTLVLYCYSYGEIKHGSSLNKSCC